MTEGTKTRLVMGLTLLIASAYVLAQPRTNLMNTGLRTDANGALMVAAGAFASPQSPVTNAANLGVVTDSSSQLLVTLGATPLIAFGTGTATFSPGGALCKSVTPANNVTTGETDLITCTPLAANSMSGTASGIDMKACGTTAANANSKVMRLYFGATVVATLTTVVSAAVWCLDATVMRKTNTTQTATGFGNAANSGYNAFTDTAPAETLSGAVVMKVTGQSAVASDDITGNKMIVKAVP